MPCFLQALDEALHIVLLPQIRHGHLAEVQWQCISNSPQHGDVAIEALCYVRRDVDVGGGFSVGDQLHAETLQDRRNGFRAQTQRWVHGRDLATVGPLLAVGGPRLVLDDDPAMLLQKRVHLEQHVQQAVVAPVEVHPLRYGETTDECNAMRLPCDGIVAVAVVRVVEEVLLLEIHVVWEGTEEGFGALCGDAARIERCCGFEVVVLEREQLGALLGIAVAVLREIARTTLGLLRQLHVFVRI